MRAEDVKPGQVVRYIGLDRFGLDNEHTGQLFTIESRHYDRGSHEWLFNIYNEWNEVRVNVPANVLEEVKL